MRPAGAAVLLLAAALAGPGAAQDPAPPVTVDVTGPVRSPVLVLRSGDLFEKSAFGRASRARFEAESQALLAENREIEQALEAEELALTEQRATLPADEFRKLAEAFDAKVEEIRTARDAKSRDITRAFEEDRKRLLQDALPVLAEIMTDFGAAVILEQSQVIVNLDTIDVTDRAIALIDAAVGADGTLPAPAP